MDKLEGGCSMKQKTDELQFENKEKKERGRDGWRREQESEALEKKQDRGTVSVKAVIGMVIDKAEGLRRAF